MATMSHRMWLTANIMVRSALAPPTYGEVVGTLWNEQLYNTIDTRNGLYFIIYDNTMIAS